MRRNILIATTIFCGLVIVAGWVFLSQAESKHSVATIWQEQDVIRLHVVANSDSVDDQNLKLKVRDGIIEYLKPNMKNITTADEAQSVINDNRENLIEVARQIISKENALYEIDLQIGRYDFPIKTYGDVILPAGKYAAVKVLIGKAEGKNWWCVLFPPLCFIDATQVVASKPVVLGEQDKQDYKVRYVWKATEIWDKYVNK